MNAALSCKDSPAVRKEFEKRMELRRASEDGDEFNPLVRDWCLGSEAFRAEWLAQISEKAGAGHCGEEIRKSADANAERLVLEELKKLGWGQEELRKRRKGDSAKLRIALRLRKETTMTLSWIAQPLEMGTKTQLSHPLYWQGREWE
jgi:hypothetical protein